MSREGGTMGAVETTFTSLRIVDHVTPPSQPFTSLLHKSDSTFV